MDGFFLHTGDFWGEATATERDHSMENNDHHVACTDCAPCLDEWDSQYQQGSEVCSCIAHFTPFIAFLETKIHVLSIPINKYRIIAMKTHENCHIDETFDAFSIFQIHKCL